MNEDFKEDNNEDSVNIPFDYINFVEKNDPMFSESKIDRSYINKYLRSSWSSGNKNLSIEEIKAIFTIQDKKEEDTKNNPYNELIIESKKEEESKNVNLPIKLKDKQAKKEKQRKLLNKKHKAKEEELECKKPIKKPNNKKFITEAEVNSQRKIQIDNYSIKLFKAINDWIITKIQNQIPNSLSEKKKISPPDYEAFTHNTNLIDIRFFLDIKYKYILQMTKLDKEKLDQLLIFLGIRKPISLDKKSETELNDKEYDLAKKLLETENKNIQMEDFVTNKTMIPLNEIDNFEYIDGNEIFDIDKEKIKYEIIKLLIKKGYKNENEKKLFKKDKIYLNQLFVEFKLKNSYDFPNRNKMLIHEIEKIKEIKELNMTLREIINNFYRSHADFKLFYENKVKDIDKYFKSINNYFLSEIYDNTCGFIKMVESYSKKNEKLIKNLTEYFRNKAINELETKKYKENYPKNI